MGGIASIAANIGCAGETLRTWLRQAQRDSGGAWARRRMIASGSGARAGKPRTAASQRDFAQGVGLVAMAKFDRRQSHDRLHRRSPRGARGRTGLQCFADRPIDVSSHAARRRDPAKGSARARRDAVLRGNPRVSTRTSRFTARARRGGRRTAREKPWPAAPSRGRCGPWACKALCAASRSERR